MKRYLVLALTLAVVMFSALPANAAEVSRIFGLGYEGVIMNSYLQGISGRSWVTDNIGVEGTIAYAYAGVDMHNNIKQDADVFDFSAKFMYAPIVKDNHKFYVGLQGGYGLANMKYTDPGTTEVTKADTNFWTIEPLFGVEYFFQELPEIGFCWEAGYVFNSGSIDDKDPSTKNPDVLLHGLSIGLGVHYYF